MKLPKWRVWRMTSIVVTAPTEHAAWMMGQRLPEAQKLLTEREAFDIQVDDEFDDAKVDLKFTEEMLPVLAWGEAGKGDLDMTHDDMLALIKVAAAKEEAAKKTAEQVRKAKAKLGIDQRKLTPFEQEQQMNKWVAMAKAKAKRESGK